MRPPKLQSYTIARAETCSSSSTHMGGVYRVDNSSDCTFKQSRQRGIRSHDHNYITPANIMLGLFRCHCKGKHQDWSSAPLLAARSIRGVYDAHPIELWVA